MFDVYHYYYYYYHRQNHRRNLQPRRRARDPAAAAGSAAARTAQQHQQPCDLEPSDEREREFRLELGAVDFFMQRHGDDEVLDRNVPDEPLASARIDVQKRDSLPLNPDQFVTTTAAASAAPSGGEGPGRRKHQQQLVTEFSGYGADVTASVVACSIHRQLSGGPKSQISSPEIGNRSSTVSNEQSTYDSNWSVFGDNKHLTTMASRSSLGSQLSRHSNRQQKSNKSL